MIAEVQKWGNSLALRIPANLAKETNIQQGSNVDIVIEKGIIQLRPIKPVISLDDLLAGITAENIHEEVDFGTNGKEIL